MSSSVRIMAGIYLGLAVVGSVIPFAAVLPWFFLHGLDLPHFVGDLFVNKISSFFAIDVIISAIVLTLFILVQGRRDGVRSLWFPILATFLIGVSCGLPLFLALREITLGQRQERLTGAR
jgi:amino acid permease